MERRPASGRFWLAVLDRPTCSLLDRSLHGIRLLLAAPTGIAIARALSSAIGHQFSSCFAKKARRYDTLSGPVMPLTMAAAQAGAVGPAAPIAGSELPRMTGFFRFRAGARWYSVGRLSGQRPAECRRHLGQPGDRLAQAAAAPGQRRAGGRRLRAGQGAEHVQPVDAGQRRRRVAAGGRQAVREQDRDPLVGGRPASCPARRAQRRGQVGQPVPAQPDQLADQLLGRPARRACAWSTATSPANASTRGLQPLVRGAAPRRPRPPRRSRPRARSSSR